MLVGPAIFPLVAFPLVIFPLVAFPVVILLSGKPIIANMSIIAARIGMIKTNCFLLAFLSALLTYKEMGSDCYD